MGIEQRPQGHELLAQAASLTAQVVVRDKDGNVKYAGPLVLTQQGEPDGSNPQHRSP
jgi:hypothetical protein